MRNRFVLIDDSGELERYWWGCRDDIGRPMASRDLSGATSYATPGQAIAAANRFAGMYSGAILCFKVGRRPQPIYFNRGKRRV